MQVQCLINFHVLEYKLLTLVVVLHLSNSIENKFQIFSCCFLKCYASSDKNKLLVLEMKLVSSFSITSSFGVIHLFEYVVTDWLFRHIFDNYYSRINLIVLY